MKFLGYDSFLISLLTKISQFFAINILWILCSIPVFTIGASTTAMYAVTMAMAEKRGGNVFVAFFREFKRNFWDGTKVFLILAGMALFLGLDIFVLLRYDFPGGTAAAAVIGILCIVFLVIWTLVFPVAARYQNTARSLVKSAFLLGTQNFYKSLFMALLNLLPVLLFLLEPNLFLELSVCWVLVGFALTAYLNSKIMLRIFKKNDRTCGILEENTDLSEE